MTRPRGLQRQITLGLIFYVVVLSAALFAHGLLVNEQVERRVWQSLLDVEMGRVVARMRSSPQLPLEASEGLRVYGDAPGLDPPPAEFAGFGPGLHDSVFQDGREWVVLVRDAGDRRFHLALDIEGFEQDEWQLAVPVLALALVVVLVLGILVTWGVRRLVRPLASLAHYIAELEPDRNDQRLVVPDGATSELVVIADALNGYLGRNARFVERERAFVNSASHELRTPVAVIEGAAELALAQPGLAESVRGPLQRVSRTARSMEQLISLLLVLAKDPARLTAISDRFALDALLPEVVEDHQHLTRDKDLDIMIVALAPCEAVAPVGIVQVAVGNLLRNAIENSDRGCVRVELRPGGVVVIEDPGHGMSPEEVSAIYARVARGGGRESNSAGIGLDLIARLCEHLGWTLEIESRPDQGTRATLDLGVSCLDRT